MANAGTTGITHAAVVLGTRPEIIKLAPVVRELSRAGIAPVVYDTGQHYDHELSAAVLADCGMPPAVALGRVGGQPRARQIGMATADLDRAFAERRPAAVLVQGDTNATLAGALAANGRSLPLVHVEAGLRSRDRAMPEEHNRVMVDHISDVLCAATPENVAALRAEGIAEERIVLTGNTVVEATAEALERVRHRDAAAEHGLVRGGYALATVHRPENTDDPAALRAVLEGLVGLPVPAVLPLHPRTRAAARRAGLDPLLEALHTTEPMDRSTFLALARDCALLVSDSGGVQEEATVLKRPLLVVRRSTERPEAMRDFARLIRPEEIPAAAAAMAGRDLEHLPSPYGDGTAARRIAGIVARIAAEQAAAELTTAA